MEHEKTFLFGEQTNLFQGNKETGTVWHPPESPHLQIGY